MVVNESFVVVGAWKRAVVDELLVLVAAKVGCRREVVDNQRAAFYYWRAAFYDWQAAAGCRNDCCGEIVQNECLSMTPQDRM